MAAVIHNRVLITDSWRRLDDEAEAPPVAGDIVSLERWQTLRAHGATGFENVGVHLPNTADLAEVWTLLADRPLIELEFPAFGDGRAYSQARLLRERYGYAGDIRAIGQGVVRDQLFGLDRCGVNMFVLRDDQNPQLCLDAFEDFPTAYQPAVDGVAPIWARRRGTPPD